MLGELSSRLGSLFMTITSLALVMKELDLWEQCLVELGGRLSSLPVVDGVLQAAALLVDLLKARQLLALLLQLLQPRLQLLHLLSRNKDNLRLPARKCGGNTVRHTYIRMVKAKGVQPFSLQLCLTTDLQKSIQIPCKWSPHKSPWRKDNETQEAHCCLQSPEEHTSSQNMF